MKKLMSVFAATGLAMSALAATPALAESAHGRVKGSDAYAYAPRAHHATKTRHRSNSVYVNGEYRGSDPDPAIRQEMRRSLPAKDFGD